MDFNTRLENLLEEKNLTQKELAKELNVSKSTISGYITNYRKPDFYMIINLAKYFDVSTDYLLGLSEEKKPAPSSLSSTESKLIHLYRSLVPRRKILLIEQANFYHSLPKNI